MLRRCARERRGLPQQAGDALNRLGPALHAEFVVNLSNIPLHSGLGQQELPGDFAVGKPVDHQPHDFRLAFREGARQAGIRDNIGVCVCAGDCRVKGLRQRLYGTVTLLGYPGCGAREHG